MFTLLLQGVWEIRSRKRKISILMKLTFSRRKRDNKTNNQEHCMVWKVKSDLKKETVEQGQGVKMLRSYKLSY